MCSTHCLLFPCVGPSEVLPCPNASVSCLHQAGKLLVFTPHVFRYCDWNRVPFLAAKTGYQFPAPLVCQNGLNAAPASHLLKPEPSFLCVRSVWDLFPHFCPSLCSASHSTNSISRPRALQPEPEVPAFVQLMCFPPQWAACGCTSRGCLGC